ncbi:MAG: phenylalanine--tRNA ligase subunit alpha [Candidatus Vogelbacteria bacterium]|nr:phenylalanine--tRNA ligase subunit alpha [Candidatus Vogelbacteria bacterium]
MSNANNFIDTTAPGRKIDRGHYHPLTLVIRDIADAFSSLGFEIADGPEIETEYYNFDALNVPKDHPARDMWDTFWLKEDGSGVKKLLRTHTSPVQIRYMETHEPPIRIVVPGRSFRYEATDATHEAQFHQFEGLMIGETVSLASMKYILQEFFSKLFQNETKIRMRPSYFPFVEPGVEIDCSCFKCAGKGCNICKNVGWIEIMGAGMVHPKVLEGVNIDPRKWKGFAFGGGIDRVAMLKYGIDDIRLLFNGDLRLVNQF